VLLSGDHPAYLHITANYCILFKLYTPITLYRVKHSTNPQASTFWSSIMLTINMAVTLSNDIEHELIGQTQCWLPTLTLNIILTMNFAVKQ